MAAGYRLEGCVLQSIHVPSSIECAQQCLVDQRCKSINYQGTSSMSQLPVCDLNNSTKNENQDRFIHDKKFMYYELQIIQSPLEPPSASTSPFPTAPKNCSEFLPGHHPSGNYTIYDNNGNHFTVCCHFDHEKGKAWTLVMSLSFSNQADRNLTRVPLQSNAPVNNNSPNLNRYRMSLPRMNHIRSQSTYWYAACNFTGVMSDRKDTVRGKFSEFDPMTFTAYGECKEVKYINIRGYTCTKCTVLWFQESEQILHVDSHKDKSCDFNGRSGSVNSEDNFGLYEEINTDFGCTREATSTTSWWFGD